MDSTPIQTTQSVELPRNKSKGHAFTTVLVDTSLLIEQQKRHQYAKPVRDALSRFGFRGTSSYSKLEFKRAWLRQLAWIHTACERPDITSIQDVYDAVKRRLASHYQRRPVQTCMDAIGRFLDLATGSISDAAQVARLAAFCKNAVLSATYALGQMVAGEFKGTKCSRAEELPSENLDGSLSVVIRRCKPEQPQCGIHNFFEASERIFSAIADRVEHDDAASEELKKMALHIRKAQKSRRHLYDDRHCCRLADAIIAIDGRDMDEFAANNDKEWVLLATVLEKPLVNPVTGARIAPPP